MALKLVAKRRAAATVRAYDADLRVLPASGTREAAAMWYTRARI